VDGNETGSADAPKKVMRGFLAFLLIVGIGGGSLFILQRRTEQKTTAAEAASTRAPRQTYEHDWAKHSLDTTHSVIGQIQRQRKDDDLKDAVGRR
jgi:hypothetical protein